MLRIEATSETATELTVTLSGKLLSEYLGELERVVQSAASNGRRLVLDLSQVSLVDRAAVTFLASGTGRQARLAGCPAYLRQWLQSEGRQADFQERPPEDAPASETGRPARAGGHRALKADR